MRLLVLIYIGISLAAVLISAFASPECTLSEDEEEWVDDALGTSDKIMTEQPILAYGSHSRMILFDRRCRFDAAAASKLKWTGSVHDGTIKIAPGREFSSGVALIAAGKDGTGGTIFVMALPSIWEDTRVAKRDDPIIKDALRYGLSYAMSPAGTRLHFDATGKFRPPGKSKDYGVLRGRSNLDPPSAGDYDREIDLIP